MMPKALLSEHIIRVLLLLLYDCHLTCSESGELASTDSNFELTRGARNLQILSSPCSVSEMHSLWVGDCDGRLQHDIVKVQHF